VSKDPLKVLDTVVGLDPSMTGTGLATRRGLYTFKTKPKDGDAIDRGLSVARLVCKNIPSDTTIIFIEKPIVYGRGSSAHLHQFVGALRAGIKLWNPASCEMVEVSPSTIKKEATGSGRASKEDMLEACRDIGLEVENDNEADAYWLARHVEYHDLE